MCIQTFAVPGMQSCPKPYLYRYMYICAGVHVHADLRCTRYAGLPKTICLYTCMYICAGVHVHADLRRTRYAGLARNLYIRCIYGMTGREIIKYMVHIRCIYLRFWPALQVCLLISSSLADMYGIHPRKRCGKTVEVLKRIGKERVQDTGLLKRTGLDKASDSCLVCVVDGGKLLFSLGCLHWVEITQKNFFFLKF